MASFKKACKALPLCLAGNYDPCAHKSVADLVFMAEHEIDLYLEQEESDITTNIELKEVQAFVNQFKGEKDHGK